MLDLDLIRHQPERVKQGVSQKGTDPRLIDDIIALDAQHRAAQKEMEQHRAKQKTIAFDTPDGISARKELKAAIARSSASLATIAPALEKLMLSLPNLPADGVPEGRDESANLVVKTVGDPPAIPAPLDHVALGRRHDLIDLERAGKVASSRFAFLKRELVLLEFALVRYALDMAIDRGFVPMIVPQLVNAATVVGTGYLPQGVAESYRTQDDLYLIGTSEQSLVAYHANEVLPVEALPIRYVGFSTCFRREAGSYGRDTSGIMRQHQFDKVELVSFVAPEHAQTELTRLLDLAESIVSGLGLPYRVVEICAGDLGVQAAQKYDIETWMPGQNRYRETHSCSNTTDFQSRRLKIRTKTADGTSRFVHTLNGTAVAVGRMAIAILENGQRPDGSIALPPALKSYAGFESIGPGVA